MISKLTGSEDTAVIERSASTRPRFDQSGRVQDRNPLRENGSCAILRKPSKSGSMPVICIFVGLKQDVISLTQGAARTAFPGVEISVAGSLDEALQRPPTAAELLVVGETENLKQALEAKDGEGLPRWAVVVVGSGKPESDVEFISNENLEERFLAHAFCAAAKRHQLARENAQLKNDLLAVASRVTHDLRTPLGGIISASEVLKEHLADTQPDQAAMVYPLFDSADELSSLIDRVSIVLKATARPVPPQRVEIGEIVWNALQSVEIEAVRRNALLIQPDTWPSVDCVSSWTERVFTNLITNALRYGGSPPRVELSWQQTGDEIRFCVRDNGKGVSTEIRPTLFQPFHLLHRLNGSRGLSLSITQRLVELQGGSCGYEPLESGSRFYFTLPAKAEVT